MKKISILLLTIISIFTINFASAAEKTNFTIKNIQNNTEEVEYTYDVHIDNVKGAIKIKNGSKEDYTVFDYEGNTTIIVKSNTDLVITDVPKGSNYSLTVKEVDNYRIKIEDLEVTSYKGILGSNSSISIYSYGQNKTESKVTTTKDKQGEKKNNPSTSDHIALLGLALLFTILFIYVVTHKPVTKYEDNL